MDSVLLNTRNKILTPDSGTTVYIDYSARRNLLEIEFDGGHIYHYFEVGPEIWKEYQKVVKSGASSGIYVNTQIKPRYKYRQIR